MQISRAQPQDVAAILALYRHAVDLQRLKGATPWPAFDATLVESEIREGRQWRIVIDDRIACVWVVTHADPLIWGSRNADPAIYIHRIAANPEYRGRRFMMNIADWARLFAGAAGKRFVRMDTVGENVELIQHYTRCGFSFIGLSTLTETTGLPSHYRDATVSLFETDLLCSADK